MGGNTVLRVLVCAFMAAATFAARPVMAQEKKPNVVFILADNRLQGFAVFASVLIPLGSKKS